MYFSQLRKYWKLEVAPLILLFVFVHVSTRNNGVCFDTLISLHPRWQFVFNERKKLPELFMLIDERMLLTASKWVRYPPGGHFCFPQSYERIKRNLGCQSTCRILFKTVFRGRLNVRFAFTSNVHFQQQCHVWEHSCRFKRVFFHPADKHSLSVKLRQRNSTIFWSKLHNMTKLASKLRTV